MEDYTKLSATLQGELIERGQLCPVELCETFLEKIHNNPDSDSIFSEILEQTALNEAKASRERAKLSNRLSKLDGVCMSWKDLFEMNFRVSKKGAKDQLTSLEKNQEY